MVDIHHTSFDNEPLAKAMSGVEEEEIDALGAQMSGIIVSQVPEDSSLVEDLDTPEILSPMIMPSTTPRLVEEGAPFAEDMDMMRQLSASLNSMSIDATKSLKLESNDANANNNDAHPTLPDIASLTIEQEPSTIVVRAPERPEEGDTNVGIVYDDRMTLHVGPENHVERPERVTDMCDKLTKQGLKARCWELPSRKATDEEILRGHTQEHIDQVEGTYAKEKEATREVDVVIKLDTFYGPHTAGAARLSSGCCIQAARSVVRGGVQRALAVVRPPGHHAECSRAMGFCFYNNTALAALDALQHPDVKRVVVLDWDVHHGNGIQDILFTNPDALYISIHRGDNFYPYISGFMEEVGEGKGEGFNVNIPWSRRGEGDADYLAAFDLIVEPILKSYKPDLIIVAAGFDAAQGDPLGGCNVSAAGYAHMTKRLLQYAGGKLVMSLEGGYNTRMTAECAAGCVRVLLGEEPLLLENRRATRPLSDTKDTLEKVAKLQAKYWPCLSFDKSAFNSCWKSWLAQHEAAHARPKRNIDTDYVVF